MMLLDREMSPAQITRAWKFYISPDKDLDLLTPPEKAIWQDKNEIEFEFDSTMILCDFFITSNSIRICYD